MLATAGTAVSQSRLISLNPFITALCCATGGAGRGGAAEMGRDAAVLGRITAVRLGRSLPLLLPACSLLSRLFMSPNLSSAFLEDDLK